MEEDKKHKANESYLDKAESQMEALTLEKAEPSKEESAEETK